MSGISGNVEVAGRFHLLEFVCEGGKDIEEPGVETDHEAPGWL
jgi:hypothetical protein